ncbi:hypothetical protein JOM56_015466 [Amanita muscaria]
MAASPLRVNLFPLWSVPAQARRFLPDTATPSFPIFRSSPRNAFHKHPARLFSFSRLISSSVLSWTEQRSASGSGRCQGCYPRVRPIMGCTSGITAPDSKSTGGKAAMNIESHRKEEPQCYGHRPRVYQLCPMWRAPCQCRFSNIVLDRSVWLEKNAAASSPKSVARGGKLRVLRSRLQESRRLAGLRCLSPSDIDVERAAISVSTHRENLVRSGAFLLALNANQLLPQLSPMPYRKPKQNSKIGENGAKPEGDVLIIFNKERRAPSLKNPTWTSSVRR